MSVDLRAILDSVEAYYTGKLRAHGPTPRGVDWNSAESQALRFEQLLRLVEGAGTFSVLDYGCGYGALLDHLRASGFRGRYVGYDLSAEMVAEGRRRSAGDRAATFTTDAGSLGPEDYAVASGIFSVRLHHGDAEWAAYVEETLGRLARLGRRGFAFNALSRYCDEERKRADLFYADPLWLFDLCKTRFSRFVTLLHDYPLFEFTILVRTPEGEHGQGGDLRGR